jgi:sterol desaturase/sphingolipid hydroxylase (fatty acid hydroxylase superfamily)
MFGTTTTWSLLVDGLARHAVAPVLDLLGISPSATDPREVAQYFLITAIQVAIIAVVLRPLERLWPAEPQSDRRLRAIDRSYTLIKLFGVLPLFTYFVLAQFTRLFAGGTDDGAPLFARVIPWFADHPVALFLTYYAIYDFVYYFIHRLQHAIPWWWALHSLHHSQRELNCWSNDRDHYLDDLLEALIVAGVAAFIGVAPTDYALLILVGEVLQNLDHANVRLRFGPVLEKILVDPRYHRLHHMRVDPARPGLHNCNYAFVFPIWDILFGTALFGEPVRPTGVGDPSVDADNRHGLIAQQVRTLRRFWASVRRRDGWLPGEVAFDASDYRPVRVTASEQAPAHTLACSSRARADIAATEASARHGAANEALSESARRRA